jgi:hypothetical protein
VGGAFGADFPGGLDFKVAEKYRHQYLPGSQEYGPGEDHDRGTTSLEIGYSIRDVLRVELAWFLNLYRFEDSADRERTENTVQADLYWRFRPRLSALVEAAWAGYAYDSNTVQDSTATQVALGLTWNVTAKSAGLFKAGYQWKKFDKEDAALGAEDGSYYTVSGGLRHFFTRRTTAEIEVARNSQESDFNQNPYYLRTRFRAGLAQRFTTKLYGRAALRFDRDEYPTATSYQNPFDPAGVWESGERTDDTISGSLTAGFEVLRWFSLELTYSRDQRTSSFDTFEYTAGQVSLSAKAAF